MARLRIDTDLVGVFRRARVLTLEELVERLLVSRRTVLRRLSEHGYLGSYNANGRFLTVEEIADFDSRGLWSFKGACFSRFGGLKDTAVHFVDSSPAGLTHEEISELLGVRVHNSLRALVREGRIARHGAPHAFLYVSALTNVRQAQVKTRAAAPVERVVRPTSHQVIAVLLVLIEDPEVRREDLVRRCRASGVEITREAVDAIFARHELEKKRAR